MRVARSALSVAAVCLLAPLALVACGDDSSSEGNGDPSETTSGQAGEPQRGGTITVAVEQETPGWYPPNGLITASGRIVNRLLYGSLTAATPEGTYEPYLAESVTPNDDNTVWTIGLREGVTFHDGSPFDAGAVVAGIEAATHPDAAVAGVYPWVESVEAIDDLTVRMTLTKELATLPLYLAGGLGQIPSKAAVDELGPDSFNSAPVGAGPYRMVEWVRDDHVTMERYDGFFMDDLGFADEIVIRPIPDDASRAAALRAGDVDVIVSQAASEITSFREDDAFTVHEIPYGVNGLFVNFEHPPLADLRIRRAILAGLDKETLIRLVWKGVGEPAENWYRADSPWYVDVDTQQYDPDEARRLVEEYESETGQEASVQIIAPPSATERALTEAIQQQLAAVGIEVEIDPVTDATTHITRFINGEYDLSSYVLASFLDPDYEMSRFYLSDSFLNINNFVSPEIDEAITSAQATTDQDERIDAYHRVQEIIAENVAGIFLRSNVYAVITQPDIHGFGEAVLPDGSLTLGEYFTPVLLDGLWRQ